MKGVVLAGGSGTRLRPTTRVVNKHVLPLYENPMIYYPVRTLLNAGIDDIMVISSPDYIGKYIELLEAEFDANFTYKVQSEPAGIAHAVSLAEDYVDDKLAVILGDNIIFDDVSAEDDATADEEEEGAVFGPRPDEGAMEVLPGDPSAENVVFFVLGVATSLLLLADLAGLV